MRVNSVIISRGVAGIDSQGNSQLTQLPSVPRLGKYADVGFTLVVAGAVLCGMGVGAPAGILVLGVGVGVLLGVALVYGIQRSLCRNSEDIKNWKAVNPFVNNNTVHLLSNAVEKTKSLFGKKDEPVDTSSNNVVFGEYNDQIAQEGNSSNSSVSGEYNDQIAQEGDSSNSSVSEEDNDQIGQGGNSSNSSVSGQVNNPVNSNTNVTRSGSGDAQELEIESDPGILVTNGSPFTTPRSSFDVLDDDRANTNDNNGNNKGLLPLNIVQINSSSENNDNNVVSVDDSIIRVFSNMSISEEKHVTGSSFRDIKIIPQESTADSRLRRIEEVIEILFGSFEETQTSSVLNETAEKVDFLEILNDGLLVEEEDDVLKILNNCQVDKDLNMLLD